MKWARDKTVNNITSVLKHVTNTTFLFVARHGVRKPDTKRKSVEKLSIQFAYCPAIIQIFIKMIIFCRYVLPN
jgi:hypothetical protein